MSGLKTRVQSLIRLMTSGQTVEAFQQFYAEDVVIFQNRELSCAGRAACIAQERQQLAAMAEPPSFQALAHAVDEASGVSFIEWRVRFRGPDGSRLRLEQVVVQKWHGDTISEERYHYEGVVDESDLDSSAKKEE